MNLDSPSFALSQVNYLVESLNASVYESQVQELDRLVQRYGFELSRHLIRTLLTKVSVRGSPSKGSTEKVHVKLLSAQIQLLLNSSRFPSLISWCLDNPVGGKESPLLEHLLPALKLTPLQEVCFCLAVLRHSTKSEKKEAALALLRSKLSRLPSDLKQLDIEKHSELVFSVLNSLQDLQEDTRELVNTVNNYYKGDKQPPLVLLPLLNSTPLSPNTSSFNSSVMSGKGGSSLLLEGALPDLVLEMGYHFTSTVQECRASLLKFQGRELCGAQTIAKVIGVMVRTHTGLDENNSLPLSAPDNGSAWDKSEKSEKTWNMEVFVQSIHELHNTINWKEIIFELDHSSFIVKDRPGLILLMKALKLGLQTQGLQGRFPMDLFYRHWKNTEGQLSLFQQILRNPDVFCFAEQQFHHSATDILKTSPDFSNKEVATWRSLDLIETLLYLADNGCQVQVNELFAYPRQQCPDVLVLGLLQINPPVTMLRQELLGKLFKVFLAPHPNSQVIITHAWHSQSIQIKPILILSMADWYHKSIAEGDSEQSRLGRILDIAQDLKSLNLMLNAQPHQFVIDLAVLSSRREYLNLEKWLQDKIMDQQELFVTAAIKFLQRKVPAIMGPGPLKEEQIPKQMLPVECVATILSSIEEACGLFPMSQEVYETIRNMVEVGAGIMARPSLPPPNPQVGGGVLQRGGGGPLANLPPNFNAPGAPGLGAPGLGGPQGRMPPSAIFPPGGDIGSLSRDFSSSLQMSGANPSLQIGAGSVPVSALQPVSSSAFSLSGGLGPLVSGPGSPNRMFGGSTTSSSALGGSQSPFSGLVPPLPAPATLPAVPPPPPRPNPQQTLAASNPIEQVRSGNIASLFPDGDKSISKEVEDEANSYFQRIYNQPPHPTLTIDEVLDLLRKFQTSGVQRETDVFFCMIKNLFEEYKFFPQYPDKELHITAQLFGGIIEHSLVTMIHLGVALRFVLDALRKPLDSNMSWFGLVALDRFRGRLREYSQYCQHVASIHHFKEFPSHLVQWVEYGAQSQEPPSKPHALVVPPSLQSGPPAAIQQTPVGGGGGNVPIAQPSIAASKVTVTTTTATTSTIVRPTTSAIGSVSQGRISIANNTNIDTLLAARMNEDESIQPPKEGEQDKIAFIFNNLSMMNMSQKAEDLHEVLTLEDNIHHRRWLAQYLVMKRASIEPNFHKTYFSYLEVIKSEALYQDTINETYKNIRILLSCDKSNANFGDRSLLKNLGHWLGLLLLARNKPILMVDLDMKQLVIEAYHNSAQEKQQELLYVVPFVAKVLESAAKSKVFKPPCPWTMGLMNLLAELHAEPDLKLNLKFEIEVLCKHLHIEISDLRPGNALKDYQRLGKLLKNLGSNIEELQPLRGLANKDLGSNIAEPQPLNGLAKPMAAMKMDQKAFNPSFGPSLTQAPNNLSSVSPAAAFSQPGSAGLGMGSAMMATPQAAASMTTQTAQSAGEQPVQKVELTPGVSVSRVAEPKFHFLEINTSNLSGLGPHITVDPRIQLLKEHPEIIQLIKLSIEKSVNEWISPVIERAIKISVTTCEQIVKKDFSLDHDENRMRVAAHQMVRNLTSGMAMITCRDHLLQSIKNHLKNILMTLGRNMGIMDNVDVTVSIIANDNVELACAFIQKKAVEKAIPEIDKRLSVEFELRKLARKEGRRYCDPVAVTYQAERMPETIRSKGGQVPAAQASVYEEFARNIPGFKPLTDSEAATIIPKTGAGETGATTPLAASDESWAILEEVHNKLQPFIEQCTGLPAQPHMAGLQQLLDSLRTARQNREVSSIIVLIGKAVENLLEGLTVGVQAEPDMLARYRDANLLVLKALADQRAYGPNWTSRQATGALVEARDEIKWNIDAVDALIRSQLVNLFDYDKFLAACLEGGSNPQVVNFAMILAKIYLIDDRSNAQLFESDLFGTIEMLVQIANNMRNPPEGLVQLVDMIKMSSERIEQNLQMSGPTSQLHSGIQQAREFEDPPGLMEKTEFLLRDWVNMYHSPNAGKDSTKAFHMFVQQMNMHGLLKTDDLITRFFRMSTQMCVDLCYRALSEQNNAPSLVRAKCFHTLDAFVRLIALLVKHSGDQQNTITKVNLLNKVLGIVAGVLLIDHEVRRKDFQQVPYHRIFIMLYLELNAPDQILETINYQVLTAYCNMLNILRPSKAPGFAYAWLEIVSHRVFIGRILSLTPQQKGWPMFAQLLTALFKFLSPFLRNAELAKPVQKLYRGSLRVLLVLLHDFPEFLCDYHYGFCDVIPPNCIQMRNLILSAFPRSMRLPDPFTPNLKVDMLPEISIAPRMVTNFSALIKPSFRKDLDSYLKNRTPVSFLTELRTNLQVSNEPGMRYNISMINALVMYVGTQAIQYIRGKNNSPSMSSIAHSSHMDIFQNLAVDMDTEGRYLFLNCIANQLRYPNSHTHYFSCLLLYLFGEANTEAIQEQITRVLLERLIVNRPHPWGLLITFIELIKNSTFKFWSHEFVQCAPEIQKLFESVARSCMVASQPRNEGTEPLPAE